MFKSIFKDEKFNLPITDYENNIDEYLDLLFEDYISKVEKLNATYKVLKASEIELIKALRKNIKTAFTSQYNGFPHRAYNHMTKSLNELRCYLNIVDLTDYPDYLMFRARIGENIAFERKDMFHIPFDKRRFVKSYRYSIPGYPSLYLGSSSFVCWNELRRPNLDSIQLSGYKINSNSFNDNNKKSTKKNVLDFGYRPKDMISHYEKFEENSFDMDSSDDDPEIVSPDSFYLLYKKNKDYFKNYLIIWPLIASCSVKVKIDDCSFKPEYIIPQILLQWIKSEKLFDGIRYFSIAHKYPKLSSYTTNPIELLHNYVFPTKEVENNGFCNTLVKTFSLTNAIIWGVNELINDLHRTAPYKRPNYKAIQVELHSGRLTPYDQTKFSTVENVISQMQFSSI